MCGNDDDGPEGRTLRIWQAIAIVYCPQWTETKQRRAEKKIIPGRKDERTKTPDFAGIQPHRQTTETTGMRSCVTKSPSFDLRWPGQFTPSSFTMAHNWGS